MQHAINNVLISIHTPTQGVTAADDGRDREPDNFNPHSHAGSDRLRVFVFFRLVHISIHTPTQGVTLGHHVYNELRKDFNPHSHAGSDCRCQQNNCYPFQISIHTPTQGVTSRRSKSPHKQVISIHTPTQGVTIQTAGVDTQPGKFQSTLPRRE